MKNLILAAAILAGASTYATTNNTISPITPVHTVVEKGFKEVSLDKLPAAVVKSVKESFPKGKLSKAFVNENEQYKLEISLENESKTLFADKDGNWLDAKDVK
ncbi:hypothetical protein [Tenacibaculum larymnensis]|uniref:Beta-lactamase-inhibitor-like PepSY-like domain-containing protein n=1 Tax=Tenacibaculum larymnensis TaxID=2878201 RepID=A0A9X4ETV9_9FLAO|nr:hypothetical protein [Tenacibaculum larymnensis]MDE1206356.1 hypothetical protein [Tenacibaculum larymnensis]